MKKLFVPFLSNKETMLASRNGQIQLFPADGILAAYYSLEDAEKAAQQLALTDPKAKVLIFETTRVVEPRRIEFSTKIYNEAGELIV